MGLRVLAVALTVLALPIPSAGAQSFLEALFGFGGPPSRSRSYDRPRTREREPRTYSRDREAPRQHVRAYYNAPQAPERSGTYRTYCVRMCDGFYFPINYASSNLTRDAERCTASCDGARLFYHRTGGEPEEMVDLSGRAYSSYPIAFKHRTELVQGCQCRPPPWTEAEMARHRAYAAKLKPGAPQSPIPSRTSKGAAATPIGAGAPPVVPTADAPSADRRGAASRPEPITRPATDHLAETPTAGAP